MPVTWTDKVKARSNASDVRDKVNARSNASDVRDKVKARSNASDVRDKVEVQSSPSDVTAQCSVGGKKAMTHSVGATVNWQLRSKKSKILSLVQCACINYKP